MPKSTVKLCLTLISLLAAVDGSLSILVGTSQNVTSSSADGTQNKATVFNETYFYEANEFLVNRDDTSSSPTKKASVTAHHQDERQRETPKAAIGTARNGRMLDLDALVGDYAASQAMKARSLSGNRQSRFIAQQAPAIDVGNGKKLHIQGFIPIVGVKDINEPDNQADQSDGLDQAASNAKQSNQKAQPVDLPYAQSSIGHASYGVQRYLDGELQQAAYSNPASMQQVDAKFSGASSVIDTLRKPLKMITAKDGNSDGGLAHQQGCLCVPFYMCKGGYLSESSLSKAQIHQMIQQQQQQPKQSDLQAFEMKSGQLLTPQQPPQPQNVDISSLIDERSFDKDIVTMASITSVNLFDTNKEASNQSETISAADQTRPGTATDVDLNYNNGTDSSQDILGRMLGFKPNSRISNLSAQTGANGVCGLLRTCCNIPASMFQDLNQQASKLQHSTYQSAYPLKSNDLNAMQQRYSSLSSQQPKSPYGFPPQISPAMMQPMASAPSSLETALAHRSSQYQSANRYSQYQQPQLSQFTRSASNLQPSLNSFQQSLGVPPQQIKPVMQSYPTQLASMATRAQVPLGSRKILDGRCGIRQSAGITGRVQNLAYHESSADFGEYPAQAAILKRLAGTDSLFVCGGTLISQYWVATAAHCIKKHSQADLKVRLGEWDVHRDDEFYPYVEKEIRDLIIHPEFVAGNLVNDIALLRLDSPVDSSLPHVNPACLPSVDETFTNQHCWVTGWGKDTFGQKGSFQSVLREVELPVVGQGTCENALRQTRLGPHYRLHSGFICAGGEGGRDACEGDGGSGLYCFHEGVVKVAGLVSWGIGCGQQGVPGVYVNIAHYRPWIENIISIDEDIYSSYSNLIGNSLISERSNNGSTSDEVSNHNQTTETTTMPPQ